MKCKINKNNYNVYCVCCVLAFYLLNYALKICT